MLRDINEFDVFFLSYDEPNAELNWSHLLNIAPWSDRIHGVKGFDAVHRAAAAASQTDWFVTVDADNIVLPEFFNVKVDLDPVLRPKQCLSWNGVNMLNGLMYGNGGVKLWSKSFVETMDSHENASDTRKAVDFCWEDDYQQVFVAYSEVWPNGSPYQAYRAGFREGVKLALDRGNRVAAENMRRTLHSVNLRNLRIWSCVGADKANGLWALYGARTGWMKMCDPNWDHTDIRDYDWFKAHWADVLTDFRMDETEARLAGRPDRRVSVYRHQLLDAVSGLGNDLFGLTKIPVPLLDDPTSDFFRETFKMRNE